MSKQTNGHVSAATTFSERFDAADSDIIFKSNDHVVFKVHRSNLECHSEGFSPPGGTSSYDEIVPLPESSEVLDLLFQYMYPRRQPDLTAIPFNTIVDLAEAAEKYQVYAAMGICNMKMMDAHKDHPFEVLLYGARHGYPQVMAIAERWSLGLPHADAHKCFPPEIYTAWTLYHAQWSDVAQCACTYIQSFPQHSAEHLAQIARTLARLGAGPAALRDLDATFQAVHDMGGCATCNIGGWRAFVERRIAGLEVFSAFLYA